MPQISELALNILHSFEASEGSSPLGGLIISGDGSTLYGMTASGGLWGAGMIFSLTASNSQLSILHQFTGGNQSRNAIPPNLVPSPDGLTLYGMSADGGNSGQGKIFSISTSDGSQKIIHNFNGGGLFDIVHPKGNLVISQDGSTLYGVTAKEDLRTKE